MQGLLLINKPEGITSFSAVSKIKWLLHQKRVGHTGTLDPMATGVLPIFVGRATVLCGMMLDADKEYIARVELGTTTDTLDRTGNVLSKNEVSVTKNQLEDVLKTFLGKQQQIPPMYSAIKKDGVRLYDLAREGKQVERKPRDIEIFELELLSFNKNTFEIRVLCSKGTYIRSLAADIGEKLGTGAMLTALTRTKTAGFSLKQCVDLNDLTPENIGLYLLDCEKAVMGYDELTVSSAQANRFINGGELDLGRLKFSVPPKNGQIFRVKGMNKFLGLGEVDTNKACLKINCLTHHFTDDN